MTEVLVHPRTTPEEALLGLHSALHPLGERQIRSLDTTLGTAREVLKATQAGVVDGLKTFLREKGATSDVLGWALLTDSAIAGEYLAWLSGPENVRRETEARFLEAAANESPTSLGDAYLTLIPADLRHRLGEHYTPLDLVTAAASAVTEPEATVLDPACGDGRFLVHLMRRGHRHSALSGVDLNPLAVALARVQVWLAAGRPDIRPTVSVHWGDFLLRDRDHGLPLWPDWHLKSEPQHIVGNPPWVLWRNLGSEYRTAIAGAFASTTLNQARGWAARVSAGQSDLAHLFVHEALELLASRGNLGLVLPRSVFKGPIGASVIRAGLLDSGRKFAYTKVIDYKQGAFDEVRQETVIAFATADEEQRYPVPWTAVGKDGHHADTHASPSDPLDPRSPWSSVDDDSRLELADGETRWAIKARGGVNTGGGNGIFHVDVIDDTYREVRVRNRPSRGLPARTHDAPVERPLVRPLLAGRDIRPWRASGKAFIVFPHRLDDLRKPYDEDTLAAEYPLALAYLSTFYDELSSRKELARWGGAWYSLFRIGPYTADCWRVVWPSSSAAGLRAAVLEADDPTIPDQKVVVVPFDEPDPAYFLAALLNSTQVRKHAAAGHGLDASPSITSRLLLPAWNPSHDVHRRLAKLSVSAHETGHLSQSDLDTAVGRLYAGSPHE